MPSKTPLRACLVYLLVVWGLSGLWLLTFPITAGDTDLWYHLNGGRYLVEQGAIPSNSFFSFLSPPRPFVDYYWLFQLLVYTLYRWWGYYGPIVLRTALYGATLCCIARLLVVRRPWRQSVPWFVFLGLCYGLLLLPRGFLVRPHLFSYWLIALTLSLLECQPHRLWLLPVVAVLWANVHGIMYPMFLLILGAYVLEALGSRSEARASAALPLRALLIAAVLSVVALWMTPHGFRLFRVPFMATANASTYINELQPLSVPDFLTLSFPMLAPTSNTVFVLLVMAIGVAGLQAWADRSWRLRHVVLGVGGCFLLTKGVRFVNEFALLALPLLATACPVPAHALTRRLARPVYLAVMCVAMIIPLRAVVDLFDRRPAYPFSSETLPRGVVAFLNHVAVGGEVLNHPNPGGYLQWALHPSYRIFSDMQVPFLFTDEEMRLASQMFHSKAALTTVVSGSHPAFLIVPNTLKEFPTLITSFPDYTLVFFDDYEALYVDRSQHPTLAAQFALTALDPFSLVTKKEEEVVADGLSPAAQLQEARRMLAIDPDCALTNQFAAAMAIRQGDSARALPHAEAIIRNFPHWPKGYRLKAEALKGLKRFEEALAAYALAVERVEPSARFALRKKIALVWLEQGKPEQAYRLLKDATDLFSARTSAEDVYQVGSAALQAGRLDEARDVFTSLLRYRGVPDEAAWAEKIEAELQELAR